MDRILAESNLVIYERREEMIAVITLNRPNARNAINREMANTIGQLVQATEADDRVRAVVLTSSLDKVFCAGADLVEIANGNAGALSTSDGGFAGIVRSARKKPWIAAVRGAAFGGGCEIALACDMIVASPDARFGQPEVKRGLFAAAGGPLRLTRSLPRAIALELLATGNPLTADRAFAFGMINRLVASMDVLGEAIGLASAIAANAPMAVCESLAIARDASDVDEAAYWTRSDDIMERVFSSGDAREGPLAFLEKREPRWSGR